MAIYITGDTHGEIDIHKLSSCNFPSAGLTKSDYVIIAGDFGLIWKGEPDATERYWLDWLDSKPWTTLFIDGNHENHARLSMYGVEVWNGGKVHRISESVIHLMRGQVFTLDGKTFFTMGGAASVDKALRTPYVSWWPEEIPSSRELGEAFDNLEAHNWKVDYVITHCPPAKALLQIPLLSHQIDGFGNWLQGMADALDFKQWFFGHMHEDIRLEGGRFEGLYNDIYDLQTGRRLGDCLGDGKVIAQIRERARPYPQQPRGGVLGRAAQHGGQSERMRGSERLSTRDARGAEAE